jgi:hypothetical protein
MAEQNKSAGSQNDTQTNQTGDPGRTPGSAEGDEQTVDEDISSKESKGQL